MRAQRFLVPVYVLTDWFPLRGSVRRSVTASVFLLTATLLIGLVTGAYLDDTWLLTPPAKGLAVHYGAWAGLITDPLLVMAVAYSYRQFQVAFLTLPLVRGTDSKALIKDLLRPHLRFIQLRTTGVYLYILLVAIGFLSWLNNIYQTNDPMTFYLHDVFDSTRHPFGFAVHKAVLFVSWVLVYPAVVYVNASLCVATRRILARLRERKLIAPVVAHPDGCYGFAKLGQLNVLLLSPYILTFIVIFALLVTHEHPYLTVDLALAALTIGFFVLSGITIQPILMEVRAARQKVYNRLAKQSSSVRSTEANLQFGIERLIFGMTTGSPYSASSRVALAAMKAIPVVITTFKIIGDHLR
jgi:hypothetical protein